MLNKIKIMDTINGLISNKQLYTLIILLNKNSFIYKPACTMVLSVLFISKLHNRKIDTDLYINRVTWSNNLLIELKRDVPL